MTKLLTVAYHHNPTTIKLAHSPTPVIPIHDSAKEAIKAAMIYGQGFWCIKVSALDELPK